MNMYVRNFLIKSVKSNTNGALKWFSTSPTNFANHSCKVLIVGGGSGGCAVAAKFAKTLAKNDLIIVEPSDKHYYQPMFTLVGGGIKTLDDSCRTMDDVLPQNAKWFKESVAQFNPKDNSIALSNGDLVKYDIMLIAVGLQLNYDQIPGLLEGLSMPKSGVCSNYSPKYVDRTYEALQNFQSGNAVFTYPNSPVKCPGAPQKICYISEHYFRKNGKRNQANVIYNTSLPVIFGVKKYADALWKIVDDRHITVNLRTNLIEVRPQEKVAVFENLDVPDKKSTFQYEMLHVTPPMSTPDVLRKCKPLVTELGFVDVNKDTLQHNNIKNVFAIGDCSSSPNSKTAASVAAQTQIVYKNMQAVLAGDQPKQIYNGYASCPLVTGYGKCILAEFDYNLKPLETFPISQDKEMWIMYFMKKDCMPSLYWHLMLNGHWNGPEFMRNLMHLSFTKSN